MAVVIYTTCDSCGKASDHGFRWPVCRICENHICLDCDVSNCRTYGDNKTTCRECFGRESNAA
jgi:hypothetical protein